jgi:hypothetical protein
MKTRSQDLPCRSFSFWACPHWYGPARHETYSSTGTVALRLAELLADLEQSRTGVVQIRHPMRIVTA